MRPLPREGVSGPQEAVRLKLLGGFRVTIGDRTIREDGWRLRKAASLVKLLALAPGHRLHREQVMDALWPELGRRAASNNLRQTLHVARRTLQPEPAPFLNYLNYRDGQLLLCPDGTLEAGGASISNAALLNFGNVVQVNNSRLIAPTGTTIDNEGSAAITKVGASLLDGNAVQNVGGTLTCAGVYDENYTFFASSCP